MSGVGRDNPRKALPSPNSPNFGDRVAETIQTYLGYRGNILDRGVIMRDLVDAGLVSLLPGLGRGGGGGAIVGPGPVIDDPTPDLTPPPIPTGFGASTSKTMIQVVCDPQLYTQGHGHAKSIVYGATYVDGDPLPVFSAAVKLTDFAGDVFAFPVDPGALYRLWLTWVSVDGVEGLPAGGTNGIEAEAGLLDSANIAFLTASKIRAGTISVGEWIQSSSYVANVSGWRINGNGTAEFQNVIVRGTIYANYGQIGGNTIDATGIESPGYVEGSAGWRADSSGDFSINNLYARGSVMGGDFVEYDWPLSGGTGYYLGPEGLLLGNYNDDAYTEITSAGDIYTPAFSVVGGVMTILQANVVETLNIAGNAVTIPFSGSQAGSDYGDEACTTSAQFLPAGSSLIVIATYTVEHSGFHGASISVLVNGIEISSSGFSFENFGNGVTSGSYLITTDDMYTVTAIVDGEAGGACTGCFITGLGGKK